MGKVVDRELDDKDYQITNLIGGHTSLNPKFSIMLRGDRLRQVVSQLKKDEDLRIVIGEKSLDITAVRFEEDGCWSDTSYYREDKNGKQKLDRN